MKVPDMQTLFEIVITNIFLHYHVQYHRFQSTEMFFDHFFEHAFINIFLPLLRAWQKCQHLSEVKFRQQQSQQL